ncbi:MAG: hypothetical protein KF681_03475 [Bdellovibrionaceae bacterium]|nr:hypothetical protein [Pseudobdellovibrionaceae bacterium]
MTKRPFWLLLFSITAIAVLFQNCGGLNVEDSGLTTVDSAALTSLSDGAACASVRKITYVLPANVVLSCPANPADFQNVFQVTIPHAGKVLARARLNIHGSGATANKVHGYRARLNIPGANQFQAGEDLCTGDELQRQWFGFGESSGSTTLKLEAQMYRDTACEHGAVTILAAGSKIDVWVGDARPACAGESVFLKRYASGPLGVGTSATPLLSHTQTLAAGKLTIMGQTQMDPHQTSNTCGGSRAESAVAFLSHQGALQSGVTQSLPPSGGMTHVLISSEHVVPNSAAGPVTMGILGAVHNTDRAAVYPLQQLSSDPIVYAGTFIGYSFSGSTLIAGVLEKETASSPPSENPQIAPGMGSCSGVCGWTNTSSLAVRCQMPSEPSSGRQVSGGCSDEGSTNLYEWASGETAGCAPGTIARFRVIQTCQVATPPPVRCGQNGVVCGWSNLSDTAIACQYMSQAGVGTPQSGSCNTLNEVNTYEWGTGKPGGCSSPTFLRNRVIQKCVRLN